MKRLLPLLIVLLALTGCEKEEINLPPTYASILQIQGDSGYFVHVPLWMPKPWKYEEAMFAAGDCWGCFPDSLGVWQHRFTDSSRITNAYSQVVNHSFSMPSPADVIDKVTPTYVICRSFNKTSTGAYLYSKLLLRPKGYVPPR